MRATALVIVAGIALASTGCGGGKSAKTPGHQFPDLEQKLPGTLGGAKLKIGSLDGPAWMRRLPSLDLPPEARPDLRALMNKLVREASDLDVAWARSPDGAVKVVVYRVGGIPHDSLLPAYVAAIHGASQTTTRIDGKSVVVVQVNGSPSKAYLHAAEGAVFASDSATASPSELQELLSAEP
jgi:hypothetical protein